MQPTETKPHETILNEHVPLSQTRLWDYQRNFYLKQGINAWANKVPFYITSNPYIANSYANIIIRFLQDCRNQNHLDAAVPFYIVEIGAGSGTFAFHLLKRLSELKELLSVDTHFTYVMTDMVQENIDFWRTHESFQAFIASGRLDFAYFDAEISTDIFLLESKITLDARKNTGRKNPFVFIANYCFDSLRHDVFEISGNRLSEGLCTLTTDDTNLSEDGVHELSAIRLAFDFKEMQLPYYQDEILNRLLHHYTNPASDQYLSFPVGALQCICHLSAISDGRFLMISSDKGFSKHLDIYQKDIPQIVFHDNCFSLSVNFDVISEYFLHTGGDSFKQFTEQSLTTCAFVSGFSFSRLQETSLALETCLNAFGHSTINNLFLNYNFTNNLSTIESILPFLGAIRWDTGAFNHCRVIIVNQIRSGNARTSDIADLKEKMSRIESNFYMLPKAVDTFFDIGVFYQETMEFTLAIDYYKKSIHYFGEKDISLYNMGLCHYFLKQPAEAIHCFIEALKHNPKYIMARGWISYIESVSQLSTASPPPGPAV